MAGCVVLFSGGQDSTTCLFSALLRFEEVWTLGLDYGQRHRTELVCRTKILDKIRSWPRFSRALQADCLMPLPQFDLLTNNALMTEGASFKETGKGYPSSFVPARNLIFLGFAGAFAYEHGLETIILGVSEADYSGYPDCRLETIKSMEKSLSLGLDTQITIDCPLINRTKAETWDLAYAIGGSELVEYLRTETHTCYRGDHELLHAWGYGCGSCPSCLLRAKGWEGFLAGPNGAQYRARYGI